MTDDPTDAVESGNAIPEPHWTFRRIFTWTVTGVALLILAFIVWAGRNGDLSGVAYGLIGLVAWLSTLYLVSPSAETIVKMIHHAASFRLSGGRGGNEGS